MTACSILAPAQKNVVGDYYLIRWENGTSYYLEDSTIPESQDHSGAIGGKVLKIGWGNGLIVMSRLKGFTEMEEWILIEVKKHDVHSPIADVEFSKLKDRDPVIRSITVYDAGDAWKILK